MSSTGSIIIMYIWLRKSPTRRSEEHTSELQSRLHLVCRLLLEKKKPHKRDRLALLDRNLQHSHSDAQGRLPRPHVLRSTRLCPAVRTHIRAHPGASHSADRR